MFQLWLIKCGSEYKTKTSYSYVLFPPTHPPVTLTRGHINTLIQSKDKLRRATNQEFIPEFWNHHITTASNVKKKSNRNKYKMYVQINNI